MGAPAVILVSREINVPGCMGEFGPERGEFREISLHEAGIQDVEKQFRMWRDYIYITLGREFPLMAIYAYLMIMMIIHTTQSPQTCLKTIQERTIAER